MSPIRETNFLCFVDGISEASGLPAKFFIKKYVKTLEAYQTLFAGKYTGCIYADIFSKLFVQLVPIIINIV